MRRTALTALAACLVNAPAYAQHQPAIIYESMLDTYFDDESGLISFTGYDIAFAPEGKLKAVVAVTDSDNIVVASFPFLEDYGSRNGVFAHAQVRGPADVTLTEPGFYNIVFIVDGTPVSRIPVALEQTSAGDDAFDPEKTYRFYGLWQLYAHLTTDTWKGEEYPRLTFWVGGRDLADGDDTDSFFVTLKRDGDLIGHSKRTQGHIRNKHYQRVTCDLFHPHDDKGSPNAGFLMLDEWTRDGDYLIEVTRGSDGARIRSFTFTAKDGEIQQLPQTSLDFEPRIDYIVPKVTDKGSTTFDFVDAVWIRAPQNR